MTISPRLFAVGFLQNLSAFLAWSVISVWATYERKAGPGEVGFLPVPSGIAYIVVALGAGPLSDRVGRGRLARFGIAGYALFCLLAWLLESPVAVAWLGILNGASLALVWPALQASIGDRSSAADLERNLGSFSLSWSAGKTVGFLAAAWVYRDLGLGYDALPVCGLLALLLVPLLPGRDAPHHPPPEVPDRAHAPGVLAAHLRASWAVNFAAYGMGATLMYLYPQVLRSLGRAEDHHGLLLASIFAAQTFGFWWFGRHSGWRFRFAPPALWTLAGGAAVAAIGFGAPLPLAMAAGAFLGMALGQAYAASVYYSVHSTEGRGKRAGIHEAVIGASDFGLPLLGGLAAEAFGTTATVTTTGGVVGFAAVPDLRAPFVLTGVLALGACAFVALQARRAAATSASA